MARKAHKKKQARGAEQSDRSLKSHQYKDFPRSEKRKRKSHILESSVRESKQRRRQSEEEGDNHGEIQRGKATVMHTSYVGESGESDHSVKDQNEPERPCNKSFQDLPKQSARKSQYKVQEQQTPDPAGDDDILPIM